MSITRSSTAGTNVLELLLLREQAGMPGLIVEGASGSGKSSFLRAGVLPNLVQPTFQPPAIRELLAARPCSNSVQQAIWRPAALSARATIPALAKSIRDCWVRLPELQNDLLATSDTLDQLAHARRTCWPVGLRFVWMIDQLEELFALNLAPAVLAAFGRFLQTLQAEGAWTLASIRVDAVQKLKQQDTFRETFGTHDGLFYLGRLNERELGDVVRKPAEAADLIFETRETGERLDDVILKDVVGQPEPLPLLEFTLRGLYEKSLRPGTATSTVPGSSDPRMLTFAAYADLGGVSHSIVSRASAATATLTQAQRRVLFGALGRLLHLVPTPEGHSFTRVPVPLARFSSDERRQIDCLIAERLLVISSSTDDRGVLLEIAHEALVRQWPDLTDALSERRDVLLWRQDYLSPILTRWQSSSKPTAHLQSRQGADEAERYLRLEPELFSAAETQFIVASVEHARQSSRRLFAAITATAVFALLLAGAAVVAAIAAMRERDLVQQQRSLAISREALRAFRDGDLSEAARMAEDARSAWTDGKGRARPDADYAAALTGLVREIPVPPHFPQRTLLQTLTWSRGAWDASRVSFRASDGDAIVLDPLAATFLELKSGAGLASEVGLWPGNRLVVASTEGELRFYEARGRGAPLELIDTVTAAPLESALSRPAGTAVDENCYAGKCLIIMQTQAGLHAYYWESDPQRVRLRVYSLPILEARFEREEFVAAGLLAFLRSDHTLAIYDLEKITPYRTAEAVFGTSGPTATANPHSLPESVATQRSSQPSTEVPGVDDFRIVDANDIVLIMQGGATRRISVAGASTSLGQLPEDTTDLSVPDPQGVAVAVGKSAAAYVIAASGVLKVDPMPEGVFRIYPIPQTCLLVLTRTAGSVEVIDYCLHTQVLSWRAAADGIRSSTFDSARRLLFTVSVGGEVRIWNLENLGAAPPAGLLAKSATLPERRLARMTGIADEPVGLQPLNLQRVDMAAPDRGHVNWSAARPLLIKTQDELVVASQADDLLVSLGERVWRLSGFANSAAVEDPDGRTLIVAGPERVTRLAPGLLADGNRSVEVADLPALGLKLPNVGAQAPPQVLLNRDGSILLRQDDRVTLLANNLSGAVTLVRALPTDIGLTRFWMARDMTLLMLETADCVVRVFHVPSAKALYSFSRLCPATTGHGEDVVEKLQQ